MSRTPETKISGLRSCQQQTHAPENVLVALMRILTSHCSSYSSARSSSEVPFPGMNRQTGFCQKLKTEVHRAALQSGRACGTMSAEASWDVLVPLARAAVHLGQCVAAEPEGPCHGHILQQQNLSPAGALLRSNNTMATASLFSRLLKL